MGMWLEGQWPLFINTHLPTVASRTGRGGNRRSVDLSATLILGTLFLTPHASRMFRLRRN